MKKLALLLLITCQLSACSFFRPHKMDIEQGNIITQSSVDKLRLGMTEAQVKQVMGTPVLTNLLTPNRIDYVYTIKYGYQPMQETRVICLFTNGRLKEIITS